MQPPEPRGRIGMSQISPSVILSTLQVGDTLPQIIMNNWSSFGHYGAPGLLFQVVGNNQYSIFKQDKQAERIGCSPFLEISTSASLHCLRSKTSLRSLMKSLSSPAFFMTKSRSSLISRPIITRMMSLLEVYSADCRIIGLRQQFPHYLLIKTDDIALQSPVMYFRHSVT